MTQDKLIRHAPLLGIGLAWFIFATFMSRELGFVGAIFEYVYLLAIAMFSCYLPRSGVVFLLGLYLGNNYVNYFVFTLPYISSMNLVQMFMDISSPVITALILYAIVPSIIFLAAVGAYSLDKFLIKRLKIQQRIGRVIST